MPTISNATAAVFALMASSVAAWAQDAAIRFRDVTAQAGLREPLAGLMGHGGAWGDVDRDGDLDVYVGGFADRPDAEYAPARGAMPSILLLNDEGTFRVAATPAPLYGRTSGALFADLDNDGDLELYVANNSKPRGRRSPRGEIQDKALRQPSVLYQNDGGRLSDASASSGAVPTDLQTARNIGAFDYDRDGRLDLLLIEDQFRQNPRSVLLHNEGSLKFRDATSEAGLPGDLFGLGHAVADLNDDGAPDFFVGHSNRMFLSDGNGGYREPTALREKFAWQPLHGEDWPCGAAFGDLNADGRFDLVVSAHCETARNRVYLNRGLTQGVPDFEDVTEKCGMPASVPARCPHVEIRDFDNDGRADIYLSAGWLDADGTFTPLILRNQGADADGVPAFRTPRPVELPMVYFPAGPSADYDADGRLDLLLINWFSGNHTRLLKNETPAGNWLQVAVTGENFNRMGLGSRVEAWSTGESERLLGVQEVQIGCGYASGHPAVCHFGLGAAELVNLRVRLPDGRTLTRKGVPANQSFVVDASAP